ncbi:transposable element Tc3 transposase [Trichonephila clavipes]|nr:transposable element Tc3 transposase [Trichonephila clavipes]
MVLIKCRAVEVVVVTPNKGDIGMLVDLEALLTLEDSSWINRKDVNFFPPKSRQKKKSKSLSTKEDFTMDYEESHDNLSDAEPDSDHEDDDDPQKLLGTCDEAHFWLNGYVNKQNCRIWSEANPQVYVETPLHPEKLTVWCALWADGIIGPYFFKNDEGHNVTINGDQYRAMITNFFIPELNNHDVQELWFQQDGATCHTARATIDLLKDTFGDRLISRFVPVNRPPRSCDLTPLDYFLWRYVKSLVYADKPQTLDHLEDNIRRVIADVRPQMLEKVIENWTSRLDNIRASRGSPMPEIIFKM